MECRRVAVLGGGPGGLYAARLLKLAQPDCEVVVYEQNPPDETFGFGVGIAAATQDNLEAADPDTLRDIRAAGVFHDMSFKVGSDRLVIHNDRLFGIARTELLAVLQRHAEKAGVELRFGETRAVDDLDADIVIASDGVSSATRTNGDFGGKIAWGRGYYLWAGTDFRLPVAEFEPVTTEHGTFVTHAYPYQSDRSTFLIETDAATLASAGFDTTTAATAWNESDETSLAYLQEAFAHSLEGHQLIGNRTKWMRFRTVTCERWSSDRVVLLGDAAHTAHYSVGSGTKLAMEDAIVLVDSLTSEPDAQAAFKAYELTRRPAVERRQELARRSLLWWDSYPSRVRMPLPQVAVSFMTRSGNVSLERFAGTNPDIVETAVREYAGVERPASEALTDWVLAQPLTFRDLTFRCRVLDAEREQELRLATFPVTLPDPWDLEGDAIVEGARTARDAGWQGYRFTGPEDRESVLTRLDLAERVRLEVGGLVVVAGPASSRDDLAAGLVSGRTDLVQIDTMGGVES